MTTSTRKRRPRRQQPLQSCGLPWIFSSGDRQEPIDVFRYRLLLHEIHGSWSARERRKRADTLQDRVEVAEVRVVDDGRVIRHEADD